MLIVLFLIFFELDFFLAPPLVEIELVHVLVEQAVAVRMVAWRCTIFPFPVGVMLLPLTRIVEAIGLVRIASALSDFYLLAGGPALELRLKLLLRESFPPLIHQLVVVFYRVDVHILVEDAVGVRMRWWVIARKVLPHMEFVVPITQIPDTHMWVAQLPIVVRFILDPFNRCLGRSSVLGLLLTFDSQPLQLVLIRLAAWH